VEAPCREMPPPRSLNQQDLIVLAETRSDRWCLVERSSFGVRCR